MNRKLQAAAYAVLGILVVIADRITKSYAVRHFVIPHRLNEYVSAELVLNRGVSWGMLTFDESYMFTMVSLLVLAVTLALMWYTIQRWQQNYAIIGEILIIAGACSNLVDRFLYGGVIDFIIVSYDKWSWPVFNVADMSIVAGVALMCIAIWRES